MDGYIAGPNDGPGNPLGDGGETLLLDEIQVNVAPVLLGGGVRLFDRQETGPVRSEQTRVIESDGVTHLRYRVVR